MIAVLRVEAVKLRSSLVGVVGTIALIAGIATLSGTLLWAAASGEPELVAKLGPAATADWHGLVSGTVQVTGAGGLLAYGVVLAWIFGREFSDQTIGSLFAQPVGRAAVAAGKLIVFAVWAVGTAAVLTAAILVVGLIAGLGVPPAGVQSALGQLFLLCLMTAAISTPVAWVTTLSRSTLGGVTSSIAIVVVAQVGVLAGAGGWMPLAAPTLWAMSGGASVTTLQLGMVGILTAAAAALTLLAWRRLQLDR